ncbi:Nif3-like dinuclear metal center hexameric protein [Candidatus Sumerlaeota bacterium]|nr:Nif3-like dinuclear metal center hexameric protein [Candidatus Sumerlaeota bacterium]
MAERDKIIAFLDGYLETDKFQDHSPVGLQIEGRSEVRKVATGVSACVEIFRQAADWGADMIVVHHGMFWNNEERVLRGHRKERVRLLLDHDITLLGYHLPLDAHAEIGNNALFARAMGLSDVRPFGEYHGNVIGFAGRVDPPLSLKEIVAKARGFYGTEPTIVEGGKGDIETVGVVSGGAWDMLAQATKERLDCYVTGNADEPVYHLAREEGIQFLAFGHHATERPGIRRLGEILAERFDDVEVRFFDVENPF